MADCLRRFSIVCRLFVAVKREADDSAAMFVADGERGAVSTVRIGAPMVLLAASNAYYIFIAVVNDSPAEHLPHRVYK